MQPTIFHDTLAYLHLSFELKQCSFIDNNNPQTIFFQTLQNHLKILKLDFPGHDGETFLQGSSQFSHRRIRHHQMISTVYRFFQWIPHLNDSFLNPLIKLQHLCNHSLIFIAFRSCQIPIFTVSMKRRKKFTCTAGRIPDADIFI